MSISLHINGEERHSNSAPLTPLADVLRDEFFLTGAKTVCREGFCGACTVWLDGKPAMSCLVPVGMAAGREVLTIESQAPDDVLSPLQQAFEQHDAVQCGMCFPGMVMSLTSFLAQTPDPSREQVKAALSGNICRCTGYERIVDAAMSVARGTGAKGITA
ncbi:MAG: (2Fe-2S)-binding protein [Variovorax sp.]|nr:(2Fe-2S)-binding protein [Variovorax sp.]